MRTGQFLPTLCASALLMSCGNQVVLGAGGSTAAAGPATTTASSTTGSGTTGASGGTEPPARPSGAPPGDGTGRQTFAVSKMYIGTTDRMGNLSPEAWKDYGYDLDGMTVPPSTTDFSMHCTPNGYGAPKQVFPDGPGGVDNSFGKNLLPILKGIAGSADLQTTLNTSIAMGKSTVLLDLDTLGKGDTYSPISAFLASGKKNTPSDISWLLVPETLTPGGMTFQSAEVTFPSSYVVNDTWVSGDKGTVPLALNIAGQDLALVIRSAIVTMVLSADHQTATNGVIAGVIPTEDFIAALRKVVGSFQTSLCSGPTIESIYDQLRSTSDINVDGTQHAGQMCDAISIGLGFDATAANVMGVAPPASPAPDPCAQTSSTSTGSGG